MHIYICMYGNMCSTKRIHWIGILCDKQIFFFSLVNLCSIQYFPNDIILYLLSSLLSFVWGKSVIGGMKLYLFKVNRFIPKNLEKKIPALALMTTTIYHVV